MKLKDLLNEGLYFVGYNKGRGQGTGVFKDSYSSYKDAKKAVEKLEKERGGSYNQIAYYVADKDGKFVRESVNEEDNKSPEEILRGLKEMAMGDLERIEDYAEMISDRMKEGQELSSWMYSQITLAVDQLNSVHDTMDGKDGEKEEVKEEQPGLWANIRAKQDRGEKPAHGNSDAHKDAVKAANKINNK